jgi:hypothetical protein
MESRAQRSRAAHPSALPAARTSLGLFLLSAATLAFEINLTRIFSVTQFYHFAFMIVSLALLGFGASGTLLALAPALSHNPRRVLLICCWGFALSAPCSYGLTLMLPFDSFSVALQPLQWGVLALHYLALSLPFLFSGAVVGLLLKLGSGRVGQTYATNLGGSAAGCLLALLAPSAVGAEGLVVLCAAIAALAGLVFAGELQLKVAVPQLLLVLALLVTALRPPAFLAVHPSPYKGLSYALQYPDAQLIFQEWNGFSRVDVVESTAIRSLPGQGFACSSQPPPQRGMFLDGDGLSPITRISSPAELSSITDCLLTALPYRLRPGAETLVLESRGGFGLLLALAEGAGNVIAVEPNPLVVDAVREQGPWAGDIYDQAQIELVEEESRAYLASTGSEFDLVFLPQPGTYHPVNSGAFSLAEDYRFTVEGVTSALERLREGGLLVIVRWLQTPPSESLRAFALALEAVESAGGSPGESIVAVRSYNQMLILVRRGPFEVSELAQIGEFASERLFDIVFRPGVQPEEVNRFSILPTAEYYAAFTELLQAEDRAGWLEEYPFDVAPPTDDHPFYGHYFRWRQAGEVLSRAGHVWQPFGGAGYLVLVALLAVALAAAALLVLVPLVRQRSSRLALRGPEAVARLIPFALLGLGFLLVEIPLLQKFILFLGHPAYAMATVLGALLLFSGLGSLLSARVRLGPATAALLMMVLLYRASLGIVAELFLSLSLAWRVMVALVGLAPLGILMGIPFPHLMGLLQEQSPDLVPWAWGINGALSVVASVLAALAAISWGFDAVLLAGAVCYLGVWASGGMATRSLPRHRVPLPPPR